VSDGPQRQPEGLEVSWRQDSHHGLEQKEWPTPWFQGFGSFFSAGSLAGKIGVVADEGPGSRCLGPPRMSGVTGERQVGKTTGRVDTGTDFDSRRSVRQASVRAALPTRNGLKQMARSKTGHPHRPSEWHSPFRPRTRQTLSDKGNRGAKLAGFECRNGTLDNLHTVSLERSV
jgi:hypothetical protein